MIKQIVLKRFDQYFNVDEQYVSDLFNILNPIDGCVSKESISKVVNTFYDQTKDDVNKYDKLDDLTTLFQMVYDQPNILHVNCQRVKEILMDTDQFQENSSFLSETIDKMANSNGMISKDVFSKELDNLQEVICLVKIKESDV